MTSRRKPGKLFFNEVAVTVSVAGPLHATSPQNPSGVGYMLARQPTEAQLRARNEAGEPIMPMEELEKQVLEEVGAEPGPQKAVFRRSEAGRAFVHDNFIKGHLRDAAEALSRPLNFWGFQKFVTTTLFVRPVRIFLPEGLEVAEETWPTHFDIYKMGRVSSFRTSEYVEDPGLEFSVFLVNDPRWNAGILESLFQYGAVRGIGGGRGRGMGQYQYTLGEWAARPPSEVWGKS